MTEAAKQLEVTEARLRDGIVGAAVAGIDEAVADDDVDADDAAELKERARDSLRFAIAVSRTRAVASNLGITTARLNDGFRAARKALIVARIDEAVEDGELAEEEADELKEELEDLELPGYKAVVFGLGHRGLHRGFRR